MKKSLVALALFGAFAATAQAQSSVQIYGTVDAGLGKATDGTTAVTKRDNNKLGFKGTEDLGNGLKAIFQLEIRYEIRHRHAWKTPRAPIRVPCSRVKAASACKATSVPSAWAVA